MELQWNQTDCHYLRTDLRTTENLEELQEIRLPDGFPDIGRVLCAWGQPVLRSKEWRSDAVSISGGVNAQALYIPEDGSEPRCVEAWLPFQAKWNLPDSRREGVIRANLCLRSADARTLSARKMLLRVSVGVSLEALEPAQQPVYKEGELPEGVQLLVKTYPVVLPKEAGEKLFTLEETLTVPGEKPEKILSCQLFPMVTEPAVIGGRAVFRGECGVQLLYRKDSGEIGRYTGQLPFAQYAQLDHDYDKDAQVSVCMALSSMEPEISEEGVRLQCGLIAQYVIFDREMLRVAEDAYSPWQPVKPMLETLQLPMVLDRSAKSMSATGRLPDGIGRVVDASFFPDQPIQLRDEQGVESQMAGSFRVLYYDEQGQLQCDHQPWSAEWSLPLDISGEIDVQLSGMQPVALNNGGWDTAAALEAISYSGQPVPMITGMELGEKAQPDPDRPTIILRRMNQESLWSIAKACGSTVEAIEKANQLTGEPAAGQMLLIPVS